MSQICLKNISRFWGWGLAGRPLGKWRAARWGNGGPPSGNCHFLVGCQDTQDTQDTQEF
jgi:hypothetical protein